MSASPTSTFTCKCGATYEIVDGKPRLVDESSKPSSTYSSSSREFIVAITWFLRLAGWCVAGRLLLRAIWEAYDIRLFAIKEYGPVIHEFDPWFNYRATEYLAEHGWHKFFRWFDHTAWYPLGRPIATTIYPGMQIASVAIWKALGLAAANENLTAMLGGTWTLNEVCCYVPAWFGAASTVFIALLTHEGMLQSPTIWNSCASLVAGGAVMAIIPAHAQRSVGGGFDNESVAMSAMCATFYFWARSLRTDVSWPIAIAAGLAYTCMVASWGGYIFVLNVVGAHAGALLVLGYSMKKLYWAYTAFFVVGTLGAICVPCVGWAPFRSLEQLGPLAVFVIIQLVACVSMLGVRLPKTRDQYLATLSITLAVAVLVVALVIPSGIFGGLSGRVKALFGVSATKTGNPLVDSVSEHRPSNWDAYWTYLHYAGHIALAGPVALLLRRPGWPSEAALFLVVFGVCAQFFSLRMARLMCLMGPACSVHAGAAIGFAFDFAAAPLWRTLLGPSEHERDTLYLRVYNSLPSRLFRLPIVPGLVWFYGWSQARQFYDSSYNTVRWTLSHPQIMWKDSNGNINDELREAYWWVRDNTPKDSRVLAWWDYGYQIAGIAQRTTIADGNTWNIEHIGLLGLSLSSPMHEGHAIMRHLADYVLLWKEDVGKSIHMAKISNNIFPGHCEEPDCDQYGVYRGGQPTKMMKESVIWAMTHDEGSMSKYFKMVHQSRHGKVRIAKVLNVDTRSKAWCADPRSKVCDAPGSWYCPGRYPPRLRQLMGWEEASPNNTEARDYRQAYEGRVKQQQAEKPGPNAPGVPDGSYLDSCRGCHMDAEGTLWCQRCVSPGHAASLSKLDYRKCPPGGSVDNIHGQLECKPLPNKADVPKGGYQNSCLGCELQQDGTVLACSHCSTNDGHRQHASMELRRCPAPAVLDNHNGHLVCSGLGNGRDIPRGGYRDSCEGCKLEQDGTVLHCMFCKAADGRQFESSMEVASCPAPGLIDNSNGMLTCVGLPHAPDIPDGRYKDSCSGCHLVTPGKLRCPVCRTADGRSVQASSDLSQCAPPRKLDNHNGQLVCVD